METIAHFPQVANFAAATRRCNSGGDGVCLARARSSRPLAAYVRLSRVSPEALCFMDIETDVE